MAAVVQALTGNAYVDAVLSTRKWDDSILTFNFPGSVDYYGENYSDNGELDNFAPAPDGLEDMVRWAYAEQFGRVANLTFQEVGADDDAILSSAVTVTPDAAAWAYSPNSNQTGGDSWFGDPDFATPVRGGYMWRSTIHELGHALGLKHAHEATTANATVMPADRDSMEFSLMNYHSYVGDAEPGYDNEEFGHAQSLMMYDILAIQEMYGANFTSYGGDTTYSFDATTGEMFIDGVGQGAPGGNRIFLTLWDGNGKDTYDFSTYGTNLQVDLAPGGWSTLSNAQIADLGDGNDARGNVFNALQFQGDTRSLIENATGGRGDDTLKGNAAVNRLTGNDGRDTLDGKAGADWMYGGANSDVYVVDHVSDHVVEGTGAGTDSVKSSVSFTLSANVEHLTLIGKGGTVASTLGGTLDGTGNALGNLVTGNLGENRLNGLGGRDTLRGGDGRDVLTGGADADVLTGGKGTDFFVFKTVQETAVKAPDSISDFTHGVDRIDVATIDADSLFFGNQSFAFTGTDAFSGAAGELRFAMLDLAGTANDRTTVQFDVNGDARADAAIVLFGLHNLAASDFVL